MIFREALESFTASEQTELLERLLTLASESRIGRQVEQNLWNEHQLPLNVAKQLFADLLLAKNEPGALRSAYIRACRESILKGLKIRASRPAILGRAVTRDLFLRNLLRDGLFSSLRHARSWLRSLANLEPPVLARKMTRIPLARFVSWATFSSSDPQVSPFKGSATADDLRDALGLDPIQFGQPLLLLLYSPPIDVDFLFPTIADADWHASFRPAPSVESAFYGMTLPHSERDGIVPQPELVHQPVFGDTLVEKLEVRL